MSFPAEQLAGLAHFPAEMRVPLLQFAENLPVKLDLAMLLFALLAAIPLGALHSKLPSAPVKHVYSLVVGLTLGYVLIGFDMVHSLATCVITYVVVAFMPVRIAPPLIWIFSMAYLSAGHLWRLRVESWWGWEFTMLQMVMTCKQIMFSYNYQDGVLLKQLKEGEFLGGDERTHKFRAERALSRLPSLLEYFSYMFFFGGLLVGPSFELKEYLDFTDMTTFKKAGLNAVPSPWMGVLKTLGITALMYIGVFLKDQISLDIMLANEAQFMAYPFMYRLVYAMFAVTFVRFKYYFVWYLAEAGCIASGLGFNGIDKATGAVKWDRLNNVDVIDVETCGTLTDLTTGWNKRINHWLKFYVYTRVTPPAFLKGLISSKMFANVCTKFTSAFWHGFYPGYYMFFLCAVFVGLCDDEYHRIARRFFYKDEKDAATGKTVSTPIASAPMRAIYHFVGFCQIHFTLNYFAMAFILLEFDRSIKAWSMISNVGVIYVVVFLALGKLLVPSKKPRKPEGAAAATGAAPAVTADAAATVAAAAASSAAASSSAPETPSGPAARTRSRKAD